ncbi:MAG: FAD-binding oxidoreductase [Mucilaginibacter sp.]|uniref:FAD-binding oxidoreductase n=1 Tax=Mucilaginibacter sp. TaxID=1882438 RepID=UPI0031A0C45C
MNYTAIQELQSSLKGQLLLPENENYEQARQLWNGAVKHKPAVIILPETVEDVQAAINFATAQQLPFSVRGGGHDWAGRSLNEGGVVINLQKLKNIYIDPAEKVAIVQGGITGAELIAAAEPHGLVAVTGSIGVVGFTGLTLGGGYGPLSPSFGLAVDNVLSAEIVLADGSVITASETEHADLFWAIRGGGGNFGVVVSMTVRLHTVRPLLTGLIMFPWSEAETVFKAYARIMPTAPDELALFAGMMHTPDGNPAMFLNPVWYGDEAKGEEQMSALKQLGNPFMVQVAPMKYSDLLGMFDAHVVNGLHYTAQTRSLAELDDDAIAAIIKSVAEVTSPLSLINIHHFHGAPSRVPLNSTAFGLRKSHFMMEFISAYAPEDVANDAAHRQWAHNLSASVSKQAIPGGYPNILGPDEHEQIAQSYGTNLTKLQQIKHQYDPTNLFKGISIPR